MMYHRLNDFFINAAFEPINPILSNTKILALPIESHHNGIVFCDYKDSRLFTDYIYEQDELDHHLINESINDFIHDFDSNKSFEGIAFIDVNDSEVSYKFLYIESGYNNNNYFHVEDICFGASKLDWHTEQLALNYSPNIRLSMWRYGLFNPDFLSCIQTDLDYLFFWKNKDEESSNAIFPAFLIRNIYEAALFFNKQRIWEYAKDNRNINKALPLSTPESMKSWIFSLQEKYAHTRAEIKDEILGDIEKGMEKIGISNEDINQLEFSKLEDHISSLSSSYLKYGSSVIDNFCHPFSDICWLTKD